MTPFEERMTQLLEPSLMAMGYDIVRVQLRGDQRKTLQIMAERQDQRSMTLNDCTAVSETVSALMDVHDPIKEKYALEVSSPGIDRPLMKPRDYERHVGFEAKIDLREMDEGRRSLKGILRGTDDQSVHIELENGNTFAAHFDNIHKAKLILTDALIDAHLKAQKQFEDIDQNPQTIETEDNPPEEA